MTNAAIPEPPQNADEGAPLMGLYLDRPAWKIDPKGFQACNNVRIEFGRVRSDLLGWVPNSTTGLPHPVVYGDTFVDSFGRQTQFAVTTTDIYAGLGTSTPYYVTPTYNTDQAVLINGSPIVLSAAGTARWATDIQFGDHANTTGSVAQGSTKLYMTGNVASWPGGLTVTDLTNLAAINPGTYLLNRGSDSGGAYIVLSQPTLAVIPDTDTIQIGSNVTLRPNARPGDQISFGSATINSPTATWYTIQEVLDDGTLNMTENYAGADAIVGYTIRQLLTDTTTSAPQTLPECSSVSYPGAGGFNGTFGGTQGADLWLFTNGVDPVVVWSSAYTVSCLYARSIPLICASLLSYKNLVVYGGLTLPSGVLQGTSIASSDNGFPLQLSGGVSFQGQVTPGPFVISRLATLGSTMMIYLTGQYATANFDADTVSGGVTSASFVGFPTIWAFSDVIKTRGPLTGGCVAEFADRHQFLSLDGEYRYNGLFIQIMNDNVWRAVLKNFDTSRPWAAFSMVVPTYGDLIWAIPLLTDPAGQLYASTAYVEHYMEQANSYLFKPMTQRDFPFTCVYSYQNSAPAVWSKLTMPWYQNSRSWLSYGYGGNQPQFIAGDYAGNLWVLYSANEQNGAAALCTATWGSRILGNARARPLVKRVYPEIEYIANGGAVSVTLTLMDALGGPTTITDVQTFNPNYAGQRFTTHYRRGRLASVTISDQTGLGWVCDGYDWDVGSGGGLR